MSENDSQEKQILSDFSEIFQENFDKLVAEKDELKKFFKNVNTWLYQKMPKDLINKDKPELLFQYLEDAQPEFMEFQSRLSGITKAVYLVVKDVNEINQTSTESYQKSDYIRKEGEASQGQREIINVNTGQPSIFHKLLNKEPDTNLPKSLEDAWIKSENWKEEVLNIPKIWTKLVVYHHYGVQWQNEFDGYGMINYRNNEVTFLNTRVEPLISNMVDRALDIRIDKETDKIERIYTSTMQTEKELEMAKMMSGQQGTESNKPK